MIDFVQKRCFSNVWSMRSTKYGIQPMPHSTRTNLSFGWRSRMPEDERRHDLTDRHRRDRDERLLHSRRRVHEGLAHVLVAGPDDVEAHRQAALLDRRPERLVGRIPERLPAALVRERIDVEALDAELG